MKLEFIPLDRLSISKTNMRYARKAPDVSDILPTVRKRGVIQPVIVRPNPGSAQAGLEGTGAFEIVAGSRRYHAALIVADEKRALGDADTESAALPCAILDEGDDADAVEASMIENMARLDPDEVAQWENFTRLVREGRRIDDIAETFGLPDLTVRRVLALGNLLPRIRQMYRAEAIDRSTVRHLTLASKSQQKAWLALADDADAYLPTGSQLKAWLLGGQAIPARHALFDIDASGLVTLADLFGDDRYFADGDAFWTAQNAAIAARQDAYLDAGWPDVIIVPPAEHFSTWEYEKAAKRKGGRVYIDVRATGEVTFHEGYISHKEARRMVRSGEDGEVSVRLARPEITATLTTYLDLHRHAATRATLLDHPGVALRLMVAHAILGSHLWRVRPEPQASRNDDICESLENAPAETLFDARRRAVLAALGFSPDEPTVAGGEGDGGPGLVALFHRLLDLPDPLVMEIVAIVMGETLASGSMAVETVGLHLGVDMTRWWRADDAFFSLLRDRDVLLALIGELAGPQVAAANAKEKGKTLKAIIRDALDGSNGRARPGPWVPRWTAFPPASYTARGGVAMVSAHAAAQAARSNALAGREDDDPDPATPAHGAVETGPEDADEAATLPPAQRMAA